jgi:hypothetical protein
MCPWAQTESARRACEEFVGVEGRTDRRREWLGRPKVLCVGLPNYLESRTIPRCFILTRFPQELAQDVKRVAF